MDLETRLKTYLGQEPTIDPSVYIASGAVVIGAVRLAKDVSIWHNAVLRGDIESIEVGEGSNVQDGTIIHLADDYGVRIGCHVTIGHAAMIHACTIGDESLIGMQATVLDGAVIGAQCIVGAGSLVTKGSQIPAGSLVLGSPAQVVRPLRPDERKSLKALAVKYIQVARAHRMRFQPQASDLRD